MKRLYLILFIVLFSFTNISWNSNRIEPIKPFYRDFINYSLLYNQLNNKSLKFEVFTHALNGYLELKFQNKLDNSRFITIIDMSLSSNKERLFIIDLEEKSIVHQSIVAHGRKSGNEFANIFSNTINSHQTSLGFYKTAETYIGKHGLSLRLDGLEFSNNNARKRAIVIHSADYVSQNFIKNYGRLGRSYGCPSLPKKDYKEIIQKIKEGSLLFIYSPNKNYLDNSKLIASN